MSKKVYSDKPSPTPPPPPPETINVPVMAVVNAAEFESRIEALESTLKKIEDEYQKVQAEYQAVMVQLDQAKATVKETLQIASEAEKNIKDLAASLQATFKAELDKLPGFIKRIYGVK